MAIPEEIRLVRRGALSSICMFELNESNGVYFCGDKIEGQITLVTQNVKTIESITVTLLGKGQTGFKDIGKSSNESGDSLGNFKHREIYIDSTVTLRKEGILPAGSYSFDFSLALPDDCPTSFEGRYGNIRYEIIFKIHRKDRYSNTFKKPVTVLERINLDLDQSYKLPLVAESVEGIRCVPLMGGQILCRLNVPYAAYAPGQMVRFNVRIENGTFKTVSQYYLDFIKTVTYTARRPFLNYRTNSTTVFTRSVDIRCPRNTTTEEDGQFIIPPTSPTVDRASIIKVTYTLKVHVPYNRGYGTVTVEVPIIIGTIPIKASLEYENLKCTDNRMPGYEIPANAEDIEPICFIPENYQGPQFIDYDDEKMQCITTFCPSYPSYSLKNFPM